MTKSGRFFTMPMSYQAGGYMWLVQKSKWKKTTSNPGKAFAPHYEVLAWTENNRELTPIQTPEAC